MTIRVVYEEEPNFPASDQHPDAKRTVIGPYIVDFIGDPPTSEEVEAHRNPPPVPQRTGSFALAQLLVEKQGAPLTEQDVATLYPDVQPG